MAQHYIRECLLLGWECISESNVFLWPISYSSRYWMDDECVQCECVYVYVCVWIL